MTLLALPTWAIGSSDQSFFQLGVASLQAQQYSQRSRLFLRQLSKSQITPLLTVIAVWPI
ncbi:MAG: hypothetical protein HC839_05645 [Leptolyngbyaceae cyanobacterium RM2_2_21]|nr:hypothetical protein [Leptolyngbyaceae cyanobacterium RM2_2_21]